MDKFDQQLKEIFSQLNSEGIPKSFYSKINEKIEAKKELNNKRKENLFQALFMTVLTIGFFGCMFFLNVYYFHIEPEAFSVKAKTILLNMLDMFHSNYVSQWSIVGVNVLILILLEQFLSRKLSKKL